MLRCGCGRPEKVPSKLFALINSRYYGVQFSCFAEKQLLLQLSLRRTHFPGCRCNTDYGGCCEARQ